MITSNILDKLNELHSCALEFSDQLLIKQDAIDYYRGKNGYVIYKEKKKVVYACENTNFHITLLFVPPKKINFDAIIGVNCISDTKLGQCLAQDFIHILVNTVDYTQTVQNKLDLREEVNQLKYIAL